MSTTDFEVRLDEDLVVTLQREEGFTYEELLRRQLRNGAWRIIELKTDPNGHAIYNLIAISANAQHVSRVTWPANDVEWLLATINDREARRSSRRRSFSRRGRERAAP